MTLNPQAIKILEILEDGERHCPIDWDYADGHGKRFTDINRYLASQNKMLAWAWCDCGRHTTKIKMRWIAPQMPQNEEKRYQGSTPLPKIASAMSFPLKVAIPHPTTSAQNPLFTYTRIREP